jgi:hypothetical protein
LFWSYGHIYNYLFSLNPMFLDHRFLGTLWLILFFLGILWIKNTLSRQETAPFVLNVMTAFLIISPAIKVVPQYMQELRIAREKSSSIVEIPIHGIREPRFSYMPDIYYIILDSYTREDILNKYFSFDNSDFIDQLEGLGFFVADCSQSNYAQTRLSLSSSLNYRYLDEIVQIDPSSKRFNPVIKKSSVQRILENWDYELVAFETGHVNTELTDANIYFSGTKGGLLTVTEFDVSYLETSLLKSLFREPFYRADLLKADTYRARSAYVLDKLSDSIHIRGPKFVFAHVMLPHPPFVFSPDGEAIFIDYLKEDGSADLKIYKDGFVKQTIFTNKRVLEIVKKILAESSQEPIIILQGDHGPHIGKVPQTSILNAYYMPGGSQGLYKTISPVNTFRYIFNTYFGQELELYEDIGYFSPIHEPQAFEVIPNRCATLLASEKSYLPVVFR